MLHSDLVKALTKPGHVIASEITDQDAHLLHMAVGICGEAGELIDAVKKRVVYRKALDVDNLIEELGDLEFYIEGLRQAISVTREQCVDANIKKLSVRYSQLTYTDEDAQARADKNTEAHDGQLT